MQDDNNKNTMHNEDQNHDIGRKIDENFYPEYTAQSPEQAPVQQNAAAEMPKYPAPSRMATAAPKPAPVEAPRMSGDTMGLRNMP